MEEGIEGTHKQLKIEEFVSTIQLTKAVVEAADDAVSRWQDFGEKHLSFFKENNLITAYIFTYLERQLLKLFIYERTMHYLCSYSTYRLNGVLLYYYCVVTLRLKPIDILLSISKTFRIRLQIIS